MSSKPKNRKQENAATNTTQELKKLERELNNSSPSLARPNPYRIVGSARPSKTGQSLSIKLNEGNNQFRYLTILKTDLIAMFTDENNKSVAYVREYDNPIILNK